MRRLTVLLLLQGCHPGGPPGEFANRRDIIEAAERCGINDFRPVRAGAEWALHVSSSEPDVEAKVHCFYADIDSQGLLITR